METLNFSRSRISKTTVCYQIALEGWVMMAVRSLCEEPLVQAGGQSLT